MSTAKTATVKSTPTAATGTIASDAEFDATPLGTSSSFASMFASSSSIVGQLPPPSHLKHQQTNNDAPEAEDLTPEQALWKSCCTEVGVPFALKGSDAHAVVKALYAKRAKAELPARPPKDPATMDKWERCCHQLGYSFPAKGTPEYNEVMVLFMKQPPSAGGGIVRPLPATVAPGGVPNYYTRKQ
jgi:hypothetical protein